jgi:hypothetical protein
VTYSVSEYFSLCFRKRSGLFISELIILSLFYMDSTIWEDFFLCIDSTALGASMKLFASLQLLDLWQSAGLLGRVISSSQGLCLYTNTEKHIQTQTLNIHACGGIRTHDHSFQASEDALDRSTTLTGREELQLRWFNFGFQWDSSKVWRDSKTALLSPAFFTNSSGCCLLPSNT